MAARLKAPYRTARSSAASTSARGYAAASARTRSAWLLPNRLRGEQALQEPRARLRRTAANCCGELLASPLRVAGRLVLLATAPLARDAVREKAGAVSLRRRPGRGSPARPSVTRTATFWPKSRQGTA